MLLYPGLRNANAAPPDQVMRTSLSTPLGFTNEEMEEGIIN